MDTIGVPAREPDEEFNAIVAALGDITADIDNDPLTSNEPDAELELETEPATSAQPAYAFSDIRSTDTDGQAAESSSEPVAIVPLSRTEILGAPPKPRDLVVPPPPERSNKGVVARWASAFPHIVWLSVIAGLAGQIWGFAQLFGGGQPTPFAWIVAAALGGTFEFMMVACSSRGLRAIGLNRKAYEYIPFLVLGTAAAAFAAYMNLQHFSGWLGLAAGAVSLLGYCAHVFSHLYDEVEHCRELRQWQAVKAEIEDEIKARDDAERAVYDAYQAELTKYRQDAVRQLAAGQMAQRPSTTPASNMPANRTTSAASGSQTRTTNTGRRSGGRATKADAVRIGVEQNAATPKRLREALISAGYVLPASSSTVENWCKQIKTELGGS